MFSALEPSWRAAIEARTGAALFAALEKFAAAEYAAASVYPPREKIFRAFTLTPLNRVKAVIVGQDPYINPGEAQGLAFHVPPDVKTPPSLANIAKELAAEYPQLPAGFRPDLESWAEQGVLLLNATLTVRAGRSDSHRGRGWEEFTDAAIRAVAEEREHVAFLLWGKPARRKCACVDAARHLVLESPHPSPLSAYRGFFGNNHFRAANEYLAAAGIAPIDWARGGSAAPR